MRRTPGLPITVRQLRSLARKGAAILLAFFGIWSAAALWFVHHPRPWIERALDDWPLSSRFLILLGDPLGDFTDGLGLTGDDARLSSDRPAPRGQVLFAGQPRRRGAPAPDDIVVLDRGDFLVGWSPSLRHPVWCAYHVPAEARFPITKRPRFRFDPQAERSPLPANYSRSRYDRGHLVPNYAIVSRFGPQAQEKTFLMSNIAPQTPLLNRGVWRDLEHRIAEMWTSRWGEIWVIVGCLSDGHDTLGTTDIDLPSRFYQLVVAQDGKDIRAFAVLIEQHPTAAARPARYLVSIDELEELTGFDFLADLEDDEEEALEAALPSRLWPVNVLDAFRLFGRNSSN